MTKSQHIRIGRNTAATVSLGLAIIGLIFCIIPILGFMLMPIWLFALIFGVVGLFKRHSRLQAVAGIGIVLLTLIYYFSSNPF